MDLSSIGEAVLIAREGRRLKAYRDSVGVWTIGIGVTTVAGRTVTPGMTITSAECDRLFAVTVARYVAAVNRGLKVPVPQHVFDALVSVCYNIGIAGFLGSTFLKRVNAGDLAGARDAILMWRKPAAIVTRRQAEAEQIVTAYAVALPRATTAQRPIVVAAPVIAVLHPEVPTPVIAPVAPAVTARPNLLARLFRWIDDTYGAGATVPADDAGLPTIRAA
ncbi:lysozyme [Methylobacterium gossipiicola]|uniref:Lysozyme n=1 Tax=Methylobacterium gossipiicola TaxID=582675 RepID=A0A1I2VLZ9_9HYPH|nr:lysozyme [Methylobacterium gossipiicola]SFG88211.1 lysozyme [Methylobacterium gossipiicola]